MMQDGSDRLVFVDAPFATDAMPPSTLPKGLRVARNEILVPEVRDRAHLSLAGIEECRSG
jgi:hypothetical protein